jgi:hypothetical protein
VAPGDGLNAARQLGPDREVPGRVGWPVAAVGTVIRQADCGVGSEDFVAEFIPGTAVAARKFGENGARLCGKQVKNNQPSYNCAPGKTAPMAVISLTFFPFM